MCLLSRVPEPFKIALRPLKRALCEMIWKAKARDIVKNRLLKDSERPHFIFIAAYPQMWRTLKPIYEAALENGIKSTIVALPRCKDGVFSSSNEMQEYFDSVDIKCTRAFDDTSGWLDLRTLDPTHVFYMRPYIDEYPHELQPRTVAFYAYTCLVAYSDVETIPNPHYNIIFNREFVTGINYVFPCSEPVSEELMGEYKWYIDNGMLHVCLMPDPRLFEALSMLRENRCATTKTLLYTPRWAVRNNPNLTSFFDYWQPLVDYVGRRHDIKLILRPHPLAFDNFVKEGAMSPEEVSALIDFMEREERFELDLGGDYLATFAKTDILLTDFSGLVREFYLSGRPVLYTDNPDDIVGPLHDEFLSMYSVNSWEEIESCLDRLLSGVDFGYEKRKEIIQSKPIEQNPGEAVIDILLK